MGAKGRLYFACVRRVMLYETESETWTEKKDNVDREKENDARIVRWMCIVRPEDKISIVELRNRLRWNIIRECLQNGRLHAFYISTTFEHKLSIIASLEKLLIFYIRIIICQLKVTSATKWQLLKMCYLRHRLRNFLFRWKIMFHSSFAFLTILWFTISVTSQWVLVHETRYLFEYIFWITTHQVTKLGQLIDISNDINSK